MLDIEITTAPSQTVFDIVSMSEFASHLRLSPRLRDNSDMRLRMQSALNEALETYHGIDGALNRMVLPCTLTRYLTKFPAKNSSIPLPYPDLISVDAITILATSAVVDASSYIVKKSLVAEIWAKDGWPDADEAPRAIAVQYQAGYQEYPEKLKRLIKIMAAHFMQNAEATTLDQRQNTNSRKIEFGVDFLVSQLRVPVSYDDWV